MTQRFTLCQPYWEWCRNTQVWGIYPDQTLARGGNACHILISKKCHSSRLSVRDDGTMLAWLCANVRSCLWLVKQTRDRRRSLRKALDCAEIKCIEMTLFDAVLFNWQQLEMKIALIWEKKNSQPATGSVCSSSVSCSWQKRNLMWKMEMSSCTLGQSTIIHFLTVDNKTYPIKQLGALSEFKKHIC